MLSDNEESFSGYDDDVATIERDGRIEEFDIITGQARERRETISYECERRGCGNFIEYTDIWLVGNKDPDTETVVCNRCHTERQVRIKGTLHVGRGGYIKQ